jgi:hypothetical protein
MLLGLNRLVDELLKSIGEITEEYRLSRDTDGGGDSTMTSMLSLLSGMVKCTPLFCLNKVGFIQLFFFGTCSYFLFQFEWYAVLRYSMVRYGMVWYGMVWYGMVWYGMVWCGMVWYGMVHKGLNFTPCFGLLRVDRLIS